MKYLIERTFRPNFQLRGIIKILIPLILGLSLFITSAFPLGEKPKPGTIVSNSRSLTEIIDEIHDGKVPF